MQVLGLELSESGLLDAWNILAKGTLGVVASILLAATTEPRALLIGVERLHLPGLMVQIMSFMLRYVDVVGGEMNRMRIARESRGFQGRDVRHLKVVAQSAGALFIRSYERGERVHLAMLSRGYNGTMPVVHDRACRPRAVGDRRRAAAGRPRRHCRRLDGGVMTAHPPSLVVRDLAFAYPDGHQALFGVDLSLAAGERVALLGPNGAGKTTLVMHLNGILRGGHGEVEVAGLPVVAENLLEIRRRVGIVFQDPDDQLFMPTVREDVAFGPANLGVRGRRARRVRDRGARPGRDAGVRRPPAAPPVLSASAAGSRSRRCCR